MSNPNIALELELPPAIYEALQQAAQRAHRTEAEIALEAIQTYLNQLLAIDPLLGLFAAEPELIESAKADAMHSRDISQLRV